MITIIDIKKALNKEIEKNFDVKVLANSVKDNFKTPAFFTKVEPLAYDYETRFRQAEVYRLEIHYFPERFNNEFELMTVQSKLRQIFDRKFDVKERKLNILEIEESIHQGTLFFRFKLEFQQYREAPEYEKMGEFIYRRKDGI